jgi:hypothetical protein
MWIPRWFKWLNDSLRSESRSIHDALEQQKDAIAINSETAKQEGKEAAGVIAGAIDKAANAISGSENAQRDKEYRLQVAIVILTFLTALGALGAAFASWRELPQIKKSADAAECAARAAQSAADTASNTLTNQQKSFEIDQRAYVVDESPIFSGGGLVPDTDLHANITFRDIGKSPALKCFANVTLNRYEPVKLHGVEKLMKFANAEFAQLENANAAARDDLEKHGAEQDIAPNGTFYTSSQNAVRISAAEFPKVESGSLVLFFFGRIGYTDRFKITHHTEFCYYFWGDTPKPGPNAVEQWHICDFRNTIQ